MPDKKMIMVLIFGFIFFSKTKYSFIFDELLKINLKLEKLMQDLWFLISLQ